ncbi:MAG: hypothetical protein KIS86_04610 [Devosia sp.]|nr:hypothetical protein [Devosia sp.]
MARGFAIVDQSIMADLLRSEADFRTIMVLTRRMSEGEFEINADTLRLIEGFLFTAGVGLTAARIRAGERLAQYRELCESAFDAVDGLDLSDRFAVSPFIVITGSYRPVPANDQVGGVA